MNDLTAFLHENGLRLNTDLGQHFLADNAVLEKIIDAADIQPTDHVVEIGPGVGVLTKELLLKAEHVTAIELDTRLIALLQKYLHNYQTLQLSNHLTIINGNALQTAMPNTPYKVVANIPYHITSPLLHHIFLESSVQPVSLTLLIQREVAEKICDEKKAGLLTILVRLFGIPKMITHVPPEAFIPPPKVDSSVMHIRCFDAPVADRQTIEQIFRLTKLAFSQKRKMLSNSIGKQPGGMELLSRADIDPDRRPETLSIDEWIALAKQNIQT